MTTFHLQIVTPDGQCFDGQAERLLIPTIDGQVGILARHINYLTGLGMGPAKVTTEEGERHAACIGGMVAVTNGDVKVVATTFEWADQIDLSRAQAAYDRADKVLHNTGSSDTDLKLAEAKLRRALVRKSVASMK